LLTASSNTFDGRRIMAAVFALSTAMPMLAAACRSQSRFEILQEAWLSTIATAMAPASACAIRRSRGGDLLA